RNFAGRYLTDRGGKDAGLFAFVSPEESDWRFSLVKMDYKFEKTKTGEMKVKEEFTPARRWSFLVGKNEKSHTAQSSLVSILEDDENNPSLARIEEAFNIETVTKEFFEKYRDLFIRTVEELDKIVKKSPNVRKDFESKNINTIDFAKKLLGQIVFLYFLQKKGWFGVKRDQDWGSGSKHFLRELFKKKHSDYRNFFNDILEPLFYEALRYNRSYDDHYFSYFKCKIPFLNGGLFEPIHDYDWKDTDIELPNELFSNKNRTPEEDEGDGIFDVLDRFNFTVKEDEPLEKEVAIDPELLGKLYEKFNAIRPDNFYEYKKALLSGKRNLEKKINKKFGVYYTPREIVHYMCQESLISYLYTTVNQELIKQPAKASRQGKLIGPEEPQQLKFRTKKEIISKKEIEKLIKYGEQFAENELVALIKEQRIKKGKQKKSNYKLQLPESIRKNAKIIDEKLRDIKVCDPAVGSGAFPVGMMSEIVKARNVLTTYLEDDSYLSQSDKQSHSEFISESRNPYNFKRDCIENSIYGVDIDPGAVEIAKLRLWLSLVVDEEDITQIKPLPNLDYKIVCGNSLLGFPENWGSPIEKEIEALMDEYFSITNPEKKRVLKTKIDKKIKSRYATSEKKFGYKINFDFKTVFSKVFREKDGFNVVIANPPYVRADNPGIKQQREAIKKLNTYKTLWEKWDLYVAFIEKGFGILAPKGILEFIISDAYMTSKYAIKSHKYFLENAMINRINFCSDLKIFEAVVRNIIIEYKKAVNENHVPLRIKHEHEWNNFVLLPSKRQSEMGEYTFKLDVENKDLGDLSNILTWGEICYVSYGIAQSSDEQRYKGEFTKEDVLSDVKDKLHPKGYIEGKYIEKYRVNKVRYLEYGTNRSPNKWRRQTFPELYLPEKIMHGGISSGAILDKEGLMCNHSMTVSVLWKDLKNVQNRSIDGSIKKDFKVKNVYPLENRLEENSENFKLKYLLAILNSKFAYRFLDSVRRSQIGFYPDDLKKLPIKKISKIEQKPFIDKVDKILALTQSKDYLENPQKQAKVREYEREIDQIVYKLYGLTEEEKRIVEKFNKK
ncbi:MAG: Eco57I restriction-modification methylase domain-containing protein, partial [Candidatus Marinimicrobia bacterium]|nr:Eco57I restriction-modification methylase domain-containing protein [Candidatus Neomarinimicrobiota bacterium]